MKKLFSIAMAAALVCAVAGGASASTFETSGEFRARLWDLNNFASGQIKAGVNGSNVEFWDQRLRLNGKWAMNENAYVAFRADILEGFWGDKMMTGELDGDGKPLESNTKDQITFDRVWGWVKIPNTPFAITVGRQEVSWGTGFLAQQDNRDRFKLMAKINTMSVGYAYDKAKEALNTEGNDFGDNQAHTLIFVMDAAGWNFGALGIYAVDGTQSKDNDVTRMTADVYAKGAAGPVKIAGEFVYQFGKDDVKDVDLQGLGAYLGATMAAGPTNIGLEVAYASGDDPETKDKNEGSFRSDYQSPFWSIIMFNNFDVNGYGDLSDFGGDFSVGNAFATKLSVGVPVGPMSIGAALVYAQRLQDVGLREAGALGIEGDVWASVNLAENSSFLLGLGVFSPGEYFEGTGEGGDDPDLCIGAMGAFTFKF